MSILSMGMDRSRRLWLSMRDGLAIGPLLTLAGHDRRLWAGGELGLAFFQDDRFHVVRFAPAPDLADAFRAAADSIPMGGSPAMTMSVSVQGQPQTLHPALREDVFRIGYEAMRNAGAQSNGTQLSVAIDCGQDPRRTCRSRSRWRACSIFRSRAGHRQSRDVPPRAARRTVFSHDALLRGHP
jgi:hypothetical protein